MIGKDQRALESEGRNQLEVHVLVLYKYRYLRLSELLEDADGSGLMQNRGSSSTTGVRVLEYSRACSSRSSNPPACMQQLLLLQLWLPS